MASARLLGQHIYGEKFIRLENLGEKENKGLPNCELPLVSSTIDLCAGPKQPELNYELTLSN